MTSDASHGSAFNDDEALLESLFTRLSPSPVALLKAVLRFAAQHPAAVSPELMVQALQVRGIQQAAQWLGKMQPLVGTQQVMRLTGLSKSGVHKAKEEGRILAFRLPGQNSDHFPLFQFQKSKVREWVPQLLAFTGNGLGAAHFLSVARTRLQGQAYIDLLRESDDADLIARMLRHAESVGDEARGADPDTLLASRT